ncbi:alpha/beta hydrolase [Actinomadura craniellae]|uniref:Alpha/beta hydrolase n=1 Tax=Actinomadura craniellae TaxID=2231787 RepID=A0A365HBA0_9ACTN|nr:alpha/beta hydrolase [Actinomadura craniellae]RAY15543.1 alpha/beta hydrolase [Actinomadura craniellae]
MNTEVAGERVHVVETGRSDRPALLLSTGLGGAWFDWRPTVDLLGDDYRVVAFDRPGLGLSPAGRRAPSLRREVRLLAGLLRRMGGTRPPVLVAHSVAGFHAEALARVHPELVGGLVLVDPSYAPAPWSAMRVAAAVAPLTRLAGEALDATRAARVVGPWLRRQILRRVSRRGECAPAEVVRAVYGRGTVLGTVLAENTAYREMAADLVALRHRRPFPPIPLEVLTALGDLGDPDRARTWDEGHGVLAAMSPYGRQVRLPDALHMVQLDRPEEVAAAVSRAFRDAR